MKRPFYASLFFLGLLISSSLGLAAPDFPPREKSPIQPVTSAEAEAQNALPKEHVTPESAKTGRIAESSLAEIHVTVLFGKSQNGEKSYKIDHKLIETTKDAAEKKEPVIKVTYKNKADKEKYAVKEITVTKNKSGTYKITASISEESPSGTAAPKITYLD